MSQNTLMFYGKPVYEYIDRDIDIFLECTKAIENSLEFPGTGFSRLVITQFNILKKAFYRLKSSYLCSLSPVRKLMPSHSITHVYKLVSLESQGSMRSIFSESKLPFAKHHFCPSSEKNVILRNYLKQ